MSSLQASEAVSDAAQIAIERATDTIDSLSSKDDASDFRVEIDELKALRRRLEARRREIADETAYFSDRALANRIEQMPADVKPATGKTYFDSVESARAKFIGAAKRSLLWSFVLWLVICLGLYFAFAYNTAASEDDSSTTSDVEASADRNARAALVNLAGYMSRLTGTIPQVCAGDEKDSPNKTIQGDWTALGTPLFVQPFFRNEPVPVESDAPAKHNSAQSEVDVATPAAEAGGTESEDVEPDDQSTEVDTSQSETDAAVPAGDAGGIESEDAEPDDQTAEADTSQSETDAAMSAGEAGGTESEDVEPDGQTTVVPSTGKDEMIRYCSWRHPGKLHLGHHVLAAISPDVGTIQKITLFLFITGLVSLFIIQRDVRLARLVQHDPSSENALDRRVKIALFPGRDLALPGVTTPVHKEWDIAPGAAQDDELIEEPYRVYREGLIEIRNGLTADPNMQESLTSSFVELISDVVEQASRHDTRSKVADLARNRAQVFQDSVLDRFWKIDYMVWLLPTIGFIGTIYGISHALIDAKGIFSDGDGQGGPTDNLDSFAQVVDSLGVAFDTTAFALLLVGILLWRQKRGEARVRLAAADMVRHLNEKVVERIRSTRAVSDGHLLTDTALLGQTRALVDRLNPSHRRGP